MAQNENIYLFCGKCVGTGVVEVIIGYDQEGKPIYKEETCDNCKGLKVTNVGYLTKA
uniref:Uncharacterized protein n=1 Tax=viral metagenome TaxID=1070528 RepID=A0A6M3K3D1_9ZZZZ